MHPNKCCTMILTETCLSICDGRQCQLSILASNQKTALKCNAQTTESTRKWAKIRRKCSDTNRYLKEPSHLADPIPQLSKSSTPHSRKPVALGQWRDIADEQSKNASPLWDPHTHTHTRKKESFCKLTSQKERWHAMPIGLGSVTFNTHFPLPPLWP